MDCFQGLVFSGGGSKGAYALGVLLALAKYRKERDLVVTPYFCGTSVGALNATLAAQGKLEKLTALYAELRTRNILGTDDADVGVWRLAMNGRRKPYHYFDNDSLRATIETHACFDELKGAHLHICATNYLSGELETFYTSPLVDRFLEIDGALPAEKRRLKRYHRINSQEELVQALLASAAIPFFMPPVEIGGVPYIDGGIGNNTPTRQAAYFARFVSNEGIGQVEPTICVINDPSRFTIDNSPDLQDIFGVIRRTIDIFQNELVRDSLISWDRINKEVALARQKAANLEAHIDGIMELTPQTRDTLKAEVRAVLGASTAATRRLDMEILVIRPSSPLVKNILAFDPREAKELKEQGTADCLGAFFHRGLINQNEQMQWLEEIS